MTVGEQQLPTGTWRVDPVHSSIGFEVKHSGVSTFRGRFEEYDASLTDSDGSLALTGTARAASANVNDENLATHLRSPEFFDVERTPEIRFVTSGLRRDGGEVVVEGELTIRGVTRQVEARGTLAGPAPGPGGPERVGIELETVVDRRDFDLNWQMELPGGGIVLAYDVKILVVLEFTKDA